MATETVPSPTSAVFAAKHIQPVAGQTTPRFTLPLHPPRSKSGQCAKEQKQASAETSQPSDDKKQTPAKPYLKLLMPTPPVDQEAERVEREKRKEDCRFYFFVLSRGEKNKDWRSVSVFHDDEVDEALSPFSIHFPDENDDDVD